MPPKKKNLSVYDCNQKALRDALNAYNARPNAKVEVVADEFGVAETSLRDRVNGAKEVYEERQFLSKEQEDSIVRFIERMDDLGFPPKASGCALRVKIFA